MSIWRIWGETSKIVEILCLITALAAVTAAVILLVHEDLTGRLGDRVKRGIGRRTGILALIAAGVWILVLGQSVTAAEVPTNNMESGTSGTGSTSHEIAPEVEPGSEPEPVPDEVPPEVSIQMMEEIAAQEDGLIYCRSDNAGIRVIMSDNREEDTGIVSSCVVLADPAGKEIRIENVPESAARQESVIEIGAEKTAGLSDGLIRVTAQAVDAEGNLGECEFSFVLDTVSPVM